MGGLRREISAMILRELIVNADDCNLTPGVTRAVLDCHADGIVSSTSWMANFPFDESLKADIALSGIGVGLHLNVTSGRPLSSPSDIQSLASADGSFKKRNDYSAVPPAAGDLVKEYSRQIKEFEKIFGRSPTHLDTHHQMHDVPVFMQAVAHIAREQKIPVRRSSLMASAEFGRKYPHLKTTQTLWGDLSAHAFWTAEKLEQVLSRLLPGTAEIMCHPGIWDAALQKATSMTVTREKEYKLFSSPHLKNILEKHNIRLIHYGALRDKV